LPKAPSPTTLQLPSLPETLQLSQLLAQALLQQ
jgi:hypothetical protein